MIYGEWVYGTENYGGDTFQGLDNNEPAFGVEIAFTTKPNAEIPVFVDLSTDLRAFSFSRGKQRELDRFQAGRGNVVLSNESRQYDPNHSGSPHNGEIKPQKRIRVAATYEGINYSVIEGFIDNWDQISNGPTDAIASVSFTDGFKLLNKAGLESSVYAQEVSFDSPVAWWRLDEPEGSTTAYDTTENDRDASILDGPDLGEASLISREGGSSIFFTHSDANRVEYVGRVIDSFPYTIEAVVQVTDNTDIFRVIYYEAWGSSDTDAGHYFAVDDSTNGNQRKLVYEIFDGPGVAERALYSTSDIDDGAVHHVAVVATSGTDIKLYVDGVDETNIRTDNTASVVSGAGYRIGIGNFPAFSTDVGQFGLGGYLQMVAVYDQALNIDQIATHAEAVSTPWNNDTPAERVGRVLDHISWPESRRELDTGASVLQSADIANTSALEHVQKVGDSEFGKLFIDKHGNVRLVARENQWNKTPVATLTDDDHYQASDPEYTDELIRNDVTVSRSEGKAQRVKDQDSISEYFLNSYTTDGLLHDDDDLSLFAAQYIVDIYKDPQLRISGLTIMPQGDPTTLFPILLALELGDWITVEETPQNVGSAITHTAVVEGISLDWSPKNWVFNLNLSPADTRSFWLLGEDGYSNLGVSTRLGF